MRTKNYILPDLSILKSKPMIMVSKWTTFNEFTRVSTVWTIIPSIVIDWFEFRYSVNLTELSILEFKTSNGWNSVINSSIVFFSTLTAFLFSMLKIFFSVIVVVDEYLDLNQKTKMLFIRAYFLDTRQRMYWLTLLIVSPVGW